MAAGSQIQTNEELRIIVVTRDLVVWSSTHRVLRRLSLIILLNGHNTLPRRPRVLVISWLVSKGQGGYHSEISANAENLHAVRPLFSGPVRTTLHHQSPPRTFECCNVASPSLQSTIVTGYCKYRNCRPCAIFRLFRSESSNGKMSHRLALD